MHKDGPRTERVNLMIRCDTGDYTVGSLGLLVVMMTQSVFQLMYACKPHSQFLGLSQIFVDAF